MRTTKRRESLSKRAAFYCQEHQASDEQAAELFGLSPSTVRYARYFYGIPMTGKTRSEPGVAVQAAREYINSELSLASFAAVKGISKGSLTSALRRMGYKMLQERPNRRIVLQKGFYYFRLRKTNKYVFEKLCKDINKAREMRDRLEVKYMAMNP